MIIMVLNLPGCRRFIFDFFSFRFSYLKKFFKKPESRGSVSLSLTPVGCLQLAWAEGEVANYTYMFLEYKLIPNFSKSHS